MKTTLFQRTLAGCAVGGALAAAIIFGAMWIAKPAHSADAGYVLKAYVCGGGCGWSTIEKFYTLKECRNILKYDVASESWPQINDSYRWGEAYVLAGCFPTGVEK